MSARERCPVCGFSLATAADLVTDGSLDTEAQEVAAFGEVLCWSALGSDHRGPDIDWRERALDLAASLSMCLDELADAPCPQCGFPLGGDERCTCGGGEWFRDAEQRVAGVER